MPDRCRRSQPFRIRFQILLLASAWLNSCTEVDAELADTISKEAFGSTDSRSTASASADIQSDGSVRSSPILTKGQSTSSTTKSKAAVVLSDYRSFLNSSAAQRPLRGEFGKHTAGGVQGEPLHSLHVSWYAPFFSGGGYCSEATSFVLGMQPSAAAVAAGGGGAIKGQSISSELEFGGVEYSLSIVQHGDGMNTNYLFGLDPAAYTALQTLAAKSPRNKKRVLSICHSEPGAWTVSSKLPARYSTSQCPSHGSAYRVGRTMFETDRLPSGWAERLNGLDEVWVPSSFMKNVCVEGGVDNEKLLVMPEPVDTDFFKPMKVNNDNGKGGGGKGAGSISSGDKTSKSLAPPLTHVRLRKCIDANGKGVPIGSSQECPFRFLSVGKWERRKGFDILLRSYLTAFMDKAEEGGTLPFVELYVLTSAYHSSGDFHAALDKMVRTEITCGHTSNGKAPLENRAVCVPPQPTPSTKSLSQAAAFLSALPPVHLLSNIPQTSLPSVYANVDCVVQPSRGEGWGRPHVEAMAMELPLIATSWSGPSEYMTSDNSYSINILKDLVPIPDGAFAGHLQAEPDAVHLKELLLHVVKFQDEAKAKGKKARSDMIKFYHPRKLAVFLNSHFERIEEIVLAIEADEARLKIETAKAQAANNAQMKALEIEKKKRVEAESILAESRLEAARKEAAARVANALAELRKVEEEVSEMSEKRKLEQETMDEDVSQVTPSPKISTSPTISPSSSISASRNITGTPSPSPSPSKSAATASFSIEPTPSPSISRSAATTASPSIEMTFTPVTVVSVTSIPSPNLEETASEDASASILRTSETPDPTPTFVPSLTPTLSHSQTPTSTMVKQEPVANSDDDRAELERRALLRAQQIANELRKAQEMESE
jgi:glycosyltransferase involved in cell wall biosynthesis